MDYPNRDDLLNGKFTDGDPANNILASRDSAAQMNAVYDEIINVIRFAGIEPSSNKYDQLKQALEFYRNANNLNDGIVPLDRLPSDILLPVGIPFPWPTDSPPDGWAEMKGQSFDTELYPKLAAIYPDGVIPDMRGCGIIGKEDDEIVGAYEEGQVKSHGHPGSTIDAVDYGNKTASVDGNHAHEYGSPARNQFGQRYGDGGYEIYDGVVGATSGAGGNHQHNVYIGPHSHSLEIALFGMSKNTINHRKMNWIVRLA